MISKNDYGILIGYTTFKTDHWRKPLFDCLKGYPNPRSKRELTSEAKSALVKVDEVLNDQLIRINITRGGDLIIAPQSIHLQDACGKKAHWNGSIYQWLQEK